MRWFKLTIEGIDQTAHIERRLIELSLTDKSGLESDELSLTLSDHTPPYLPLPTKGNRIQLWLAKSDGTLIDKGSYTIDEAEHSGTPDQIQIRAKSADMKGTLKVKRSESHHDTTLGELAKATASRHQLQLSISAESAAIPIPHLDQRNESDINILSRLAKEHDLLCSIKQGRLVIKPAATQQTASGQRLTGITLMRSAGDQHRYSRADRDTDYDAHASSYTDPKTGETKTVYRDAKGHFAHNPTKPKHASKPARNQKDAETQAHSAAKQTARSTAEFSLTLASLRPELVPETPVTLSGWRDYIDGQKWQIAELTHTLSSSSVSTALKLTTGATS